MAIIIPANSASGGYDVANSLRFNDGQTDYLNRTPGSAGNRKTWTWSAWIKFGVLGIDRNLFGAYADANDNFKINVADTDSMSMRFYNGTEYQLVLNRLFRDTSAWYHLVCAVDTTLASSGDRFKIYVNGVRETSFAAEAQPTQDLQMTINNTTATQIGRFNTSAYFDGYMAEVCLIDGLQLAADQFGEFDEDSGIWKPINVSGLTFGTNGFYLDFEDSSALGDDAKGSNDFTVNNLTAIDQGTDSCTNNFCTMNFLDNYYAGSTFSNGNNKVATTNSAYTYNTSTIGVSSGKWYCEVNAVDVTSAAALIGIVGTISTSSSLYIGSASDAYSYENSGAIYNSGNATNSWGATWTDDDIIGIAIDSDNNKLYFSKNGTWQNSGDPTSGATGTGAISISTSTTGFYFLALGDWSGSASVKFFTNFGSPPYAISSGNADGNGYGNFEYAVPNSYYSLCSKNLAEYGG